MNPVAHQRPSRLLALVLMLVIHLPACYSWRVESSSPLRPTSRPQDMTLILADGRRLALRQAAFAGDSLVGFVSGTQLENVVAVATRDIVAVQYDSVRVTLADGTRLLLRQVAFGRDSVAGSFQEGGLDRHVAIATDEIHTLETPQPDPVQAATYVLVAAGVIAGIIATVVVLQTKAELERLFPR